MTTETLNEVRNPHLKDLPYYKSHKVVQAIKIASIGTPLGQHHLRLLVPDNERVQPFVVDAIWVSIHKFQPGWYLVVYDNGYQSGSPPEAFEEGYTYTTKPLKNVTAPDTRTSGMDRLERLVMAARYGYAVVGMSFWKDAQYDGVLVQVRENVQADSPVWKPMSDKAEDYSEDIRREYEALATYLLVNRDHLKNLNAPKMEDFTPAAYVQLCGQKIDPLEYLAPNDIRKILFEVRQMPPWNNHNALDLLLHEDPSMFQMFKQHLEVTTQAFLQARKEEDLARGVPTPA